MLSALSIHNVEDVLAPTGDINPASVGGESSHLGRLNVFDHLHDLVRLRVDHIKGRSAFVVDIDAGRTRR